MRRIESGEPTERGEEPKRIEKSDLIIRRGEREADRILALDRQLTRAEHLRVEEEIHYIDKVLAKADITGSNKSVVPRPPQNPR